ncbi:hypothetical protein E1B28_001415 [Marasmius oreades]|uniref:glycogenin glucosyltransferase n=1 Tax=Marasmius oreades TaxID=181124 RepID=A0A9P8AFM3_9AGAR|nr:uncharacterized protein E1B28_001415 [Marasmius oreades]KAG7099585.1 hypothetical protein E1B28_001415 [Marasmius oreades]
MAAPYAFVTLVTSDSYLPGALTLAAALQDIHPFPLVHPEVSFQTVCLVTPETVDVSTIKLLRRAFNIVVGVEVIIQEVDKGLQLLGRPDLSTALTKLHVFRLTQYTKIIFLDADVLPIRPISHLFTLSHEFSAVPDVGWPDIFNSGVMVLSPGEEKFHDIQQLLQSKGSWDGADQGLLNEWRGNNWNRISFTYNTTPTAVYTYAPAYERFGSKISAIHFIGPNKPWDLIPNRPPFQSTSQPEVPQRAYDYNSLLDRWFAVYDKYYRNRVIVPDANFEVRRYLSAWSEQSGAKPDMASSSSGESALSGTLGLEDLRRLAVEGMSSVNFGSMHANISGEGEYRSLPLDGRFDLMRLSLTREEYNPILTPEDVPPSPHPHPHPHPHPVPLPHIDTFQSKHNVHDIVEPPKTAPNHHFPSDTYFPNQWDQAPPSKHNQPSQPSGPTTDSTALFEPPPPPQIPEPLQKQGHYRNVIGTDISHTPHPSKVKPVFPWEGQQRQPPGRVFPPGEAPSPSQFASHLQEEKPATRVSSEVHPATSPSRSTAQSPQNVPTSLTFANAWDTVPSIQRYASKLVQPPPLVPLAAPFDSNDYRKSKNWSDRAEVSSRDGDDEDNADDDDSSVMRWADSDNETDVANTRSRSSSNVSASYSSKGRKKEYRVRGVQTLSRDTRDQAVQVDPIDPLKVQSPTPRTNEERTNRHRKTSLSAHPGSSKKQWSPPTTSTAPPVISTVSEVLHITSNKRNSTGSPSTPPHESPRSLANDWSNEINVASTTLEATNGASPKSQTRTDLRSAIEPGGPTRQVSHDGSSWTSTTSPPSSIGPISPTDNTPISPQRKAGRVWDPARGVELFKRGSEEVLARFLKMSSWDESPR